MMRSLLTCLVVLTLPLNAGAQSGADLFQQGLQKERVGGDVKGAIAIYERVIRENATNRELAAKALVQLGEAYETLGKSDARSAYERVVRDYGEQSQQVAIARARLAALTPAIASRNEPVLRRIWSGKGADGFGAPTRDGRYLTFVDWDTGDLAVRDLTTGENRRITDKGPWTQNASFALISRPSPDGKKVAYTWFNTTAQTELRVANIDGTQARVLYSNPETEYIQPSDWSPDGKQLVVSIFPYRSTVAHLGLISVSDGSVRILKTVDWRGPDRMRFSPDGKYILYDAAVVGTAPEQRDVYVIGVDGKSESTIVHSPAHDLAFGWTSDGANVLYTTDRQGSMSVWIVPVKNGKPAGEAQLVRRDAEFVAVPMGATASGSFFYYTQPAPPDMYLASLDPHTGRVVGEPTRIVDRYLGPNRGLAWTRDGKTIAYLSARRPGSADRSAVQLVVRSLDTGAEYVVRTPLSSISPPRWSQDDQSLVVSARDEKGTRGVYRIDPKTGATTLIKAGQIRLAYGWPAEKGTLISYTQNFRERKFTVERHNLETGEVKEIARSASNIYDAAVSPDGLQVVYPVIDSVTGHLMIVSTNGGEPREIYRLPTEYALTCCGAMVWSTDNKYIYIAQYKKTESPRTSILRVPVAGGPPEETGITMDQIQTIRPHPDGRRIAFTAGRLDVEVWSMENFAPAPSKLTKRH